MSNVISLPPAHPRCDIHLGFSALELDTDDEREWDAICDRVEAELRAARDTVLSGGANSISLIIHVNAAAID